MAAATMYVTPAGAGAKDGTTWATAFGEAEFETDIEANAEPGDIYYLKAGTYTLDSTIDSSLKDGTAVAPISIIGVKAATSAEPPTVADWGTWTVAHDADDCPLIVCGASYIFKVGDYYKIYNIRATGGSDPVIYPGAYDIIYNCSAAQTSTASTTRYAFYGGASIMIKCEAVGPDATHGNGTNLISIFCYLHDCNVGMIAASDLYYIGNIIDTCTTGISVVSADRVSLINNTIYNCTTCISATDAYRMAAINNIIDTCTDGFLWTTQTDCNFFAYNHAGNSVTDMWDLVEETVAAHKDNWVTSGDPHFTNEAAGDFSLESDSPCLDAGMAMTLGVG